METRLLPCELPLAYPDEKPGSLDVLIVLSDGSRMNLEMQMYFYEFWDSRILFYLSKMFSGQLKKGDSYGKLRRCIHVSILNFTRFEDNDCYHVIHFYDGASQKRYTDLMELQFLELPKLPPEARSEKGILRWMRFLRGKSRKEFEEMAKHDIYMQEACDTLVRLSADQKKRLRYEARERAIRDYNSMIESAEERGRKAGLQSGIQTGIQLSKKVFQLKLQGVSDQEIAHLCNITEEEVAEILS